ncbi:MAG: glycosyltransferase family 4 protein, partial [Chloroflexota bacterium]
MRVGVLTYGLDRPLTGIGRYAAQLLRALATLPGCPEIVLITTEREDRHGLWSTFERHALPVGRALPSLLTVGNPLLALAARRHDLDLIHDPNGIAPFLWLEPRARRIVTIHDTFAHVCPGHHNRLDNWRYWFMLPRAARRADVVLTDSQHSADDLTKYLGVARGQIRAIPCGVDSAFHPVTEQSEVSDRLAHHGIAQPYLLYVGGINPRKNLARLLEAYARLRGRHPTTRLVIVGKPQWKTDEIGATLRRLALAPHVHFTGHVAESDLPALYSGAQAFVFPSLYEGFGLPPLEAMACGTPVITSNVSSLPEVVGDAALLVDPLDVDA